MQRENNNKVLLIIRTTDMKINFRNGIDKEIEKVIEDNGLTLICDENMDIEISEEDLAKLIKLAPAIEDDIYYID